jgi:hypothetical protein
VKFSDIREDDWLSLMPYLDTCLLPVAGLAGTEPPWLAARRLEKLRDLLDLVEKPYRGRVVTYPAFQYVTSAPLADELERLCRNVKQAGFRHAVVALADGALLGGRTIPSCDLLITEEADADFVRKGLTALWTPQGA